MSSQASRWVVRRWTFLTQVVFEYKVLVTSAVRYAEVFYHALATGASVSMAHEQTRQALHDNRRRHLQLL